MFPNLQPRKIKTVISQGEQSADKLIMRQLLQSINSLSAKIECLQNSNMSSLPQDYRFESLNIPIPRLKQTKRKTQIDNFLGSLSKKVFSVAFGLLKAGQLTDKQTKIYCSQKLLCSILQLISLNDLTVSQIEAINESLKQKILPYFASKYPLTQQTGANQNLSKLIITKNNLDGSEHDLVHRSGVKFQYKESRNYNKEIMKFLNYLIRKSEEKWGVFQKDVQILFEKIENQDLVISMQNFDPVSPTKNKHPNYTHSIIESQQKQLEYRKNVKSYTKQAIGKKLPDHLKPFTQQQIQEENLRLENPELIRIVTKWCEQLQKYYNIESIIDRQKPFRMRDNSIRYFDQKEVLVVLAGLLEKQKQIPDTFLHAANKNNFSNQQHFGKLEVEESLQIFSEDEAKMGYFSSTMFLTCQNYLKGYLNSLIHGILTALDYFQTIMRYSSNNIIKQAMINYEQTKNPKHLQVLITKSRYEKMKKIQDTNSILPELITFTVGDLLRCKISSKEQEIKALYCQIERISLENQQLFKIIRLKNRLGKPTNDILVNLVYQQQIIIEMQLAIKTQKSAFIEHSNTFSHYLYELSRARFGPIMQMCSIIAGKDPRLKFFLNHTIENNLRKSRNSSKMMKICKHEKRNIFLPFECSYCRYQYFQCEYSDGHIHCRQCSSNICVLCQFQTKNHSEKWKNINFKETDRQKLKHIEINYERDASSIFQKIPQQGYLIPLKVLTKEQVPIIPIQFIKLCENKTVYLLEHDNKQILYSYERECVQQVRTLFLKNIVVGKPQSYENKDKDLQEVRQSLRVYYLLPKYIRECLKYQKNSIKLEKQNLRNYQPLLQNFNFPTKQPKLFIKNINFSQNFLTNSPQFTQLLTFLPNLQQIFLNFNEFNSFPSEINNISSLQQISLKFNKIKRFPDLHLLDQLKILELSSNQINSMMKLPCKLEVLDLAKNRIQMIGEEIGESTKIRDLRLSENKLMELPKSIGKLVNLQRLEIQKNALTKLPDELCKCSRIQYLSAQQNKLQKLPIDFGEISSLKYLELSSNKLFSISESFCRLSNLEILYIRNNQLSMLPTCIYKLKNLKKLEITQNKLEELPESFSMLESLEEFFISFNRLRKLPTEIGNLSKLVELQASHNELQELPQSIGGMHQLAALHIRNNKLKKLVDSIGKMTNLKKITMQNNGIYDLPNNFFALNLIEIRVSYQNLSQQSKNKIDQIQSKGCKITRV